ncbi:MAG: hypothetical protein QOI38_2276 [Sphingomonadales bacterium]|jgi:hypothetical protein|nr:hypothetical protein [Sphingomonadales bacterium]
MSDITDQDEGQLGFDLGGAPSGGPFQPNLDEIREDLRSILVAARSVSAENPWDERTFRYNKVVFPQMTRWLPDEEAQQLCFEFSLELQRIETLLAA